MTTEGRQAPRLRAQYGEYASPEEQARAKGLSESEHRAPAPNPAPETAAAATTSTVQPKRLHPVDRVFTLALLGVGLFSVLSSIPGYLGMADTLQSVYDQVGAGTYSETELAANLGIAAIVTLIVLWVGTAALSALMLKRKRISWWIPIVGGAVSFIALMVIVTIALMSDPAFIASLS